jgi:hypothetical protein
MYFVQAIIEAIVVVATIDISSIVYSVNSERQRGRGETEGRNRGGDTGREIGEGLRRDETGERKRRGMGENRRETDKR